MHAARKHRPTAPVRPVLVAALALTACSTEDPFSPIPPVHPLPAESITRPQIAFVSNRDGREYAHVADADGSAVGRLALGSAPAWSWDGEKIAYVGESGAGIHVRDPDGSNQLRLTQGGGSPAWSPDGRITFEMFDTGSWGIFVMNADGTGITKLIDAEADFPVDGSADDCYYGCEPSVRAATWSPDGQTIAFTRSSSGSDQLYLMPVDGTDLRRFAESPRFMQPAFSPDGATLAFEFLDLLSLFQCDGWHSSSSPVRTQQRIYLVQLAGRRWQQLVPDAVDPRQEVYDDYAPTWAPVAR